MRTKRTKLQRFLIKYGACREARDYLRRRKLTTFAVAWDHVVASGQHERWLSWAVSTLTTMHVVRGAESEVLWNAARRCWFGNSELRTAVMAAWRTVCL